MGYIAARVDCMSFVELIIRGTYTTLTDTTTPTLTSTVTDAPDEGPTSVIATIPVGAGLNGVGVSHSTNRVYVVNQNDDIVSVIEFE